MHGPPLEFALKPDVVPKAVYTPSVVPRHWEDKIRRDLDQDVAMGVLEKVDVNEPVTWCSRMVVTRKHNGEPRRTIDLQALNEASLRQTHPTMPPFQKAMSVPPGHWKSTTDAFNGYHSALYASLTDTSPLSSPRGVGIGTKRRRRGTRPPATPTPTDSIRSLSMFRTVTES